MTARVRLHNWWFSWRPVLIGAVTVLVSGVLVNELTSMIDRAVKGPATDASRWPPAGEAGLIVGFALGLLTLVLFWHRFIAQERQRSQTRDLGRAQQ
jgi:hypothetical protein